MSSSLCVLISFRGAQVCIILLRYILQVMRFKLPLNAIVSVYMEPNDVCTSIFIWAEVSALLAVCTHAFTLTVDPATGVYEVGR